MTIRFGCAHLAAAVAAIAIAFGLAPAARAATPLDPLLGLLTGEQTTDPPPPAEDAPFEAHGSAEQVYVTGADPGAELTLSDGGGRTVATETVNSLGGALFRNVSPGGGYVVRQASGGATSPPLRVMSTQAAPPSTDVYDQQLPSRGYGYLTTRDGTKLAISVHPPQDVASLLPDGSKLPTIPSGPTPTLIEYSGYGYADPDQPQNGIAVLANLMGFTVVDVNMRGTGCSGGAFDFFEPLQNLDGYDVIETVARQPWVLHHEVGMMGISYGGISQLFTAQLDPPSLAAISPLSVIDSTQTTLYPGGILNTGFAVAWAQERVHDALPASPDGGQAYAWQRVQDGDATCEANQALHPEAVDLMAKIRANAHYAPAVADPLAPVTFVDKIDVPVYMACQWTDEQTGGHCPTLAEHMTGTRRAWFTFTNGTHVDSLDPETFNRWYDFLSLYVAHRAPILNAAVVRAAAPLIYQEAMGIPGVTLPRDPVQEQLTYQGALTAFEQLKPIRVLFDNGAGGTAIGAGAVTAWVRSSAPNVDLQATISEVRPDGQEVYVQSGWLRANERALDASRSTPLEPVLSLRASDVSPLPADRFVPVTIPLYYQGHAYRAGSRLRVTISAPNGDQPIWAFGETDPAGTATVAIAHSRAMPSRLLLPVVSAVDVPAGLPPCPGLRGEPCRDYQPYVNG